MAQCRITKVFTKTVMSGRPQCILEASVIIMLHYISLAECDVLYRFWHI